MAWGQLIWFALVVVLWSGVLLAFPLDPDYTAGELLDHLAGWRETGTLYPPLGTGPTLRVLNYPPLGLVLARILTLMGLPELSAGRLVNAAGLIALVAAVWGWTRARGHRGAALIGTVGLLGASFPVLYGSGQFHIELWAAAFTVAGIGLLDRGSSAGTVAMGGLSLALACLTKQTQVVPALVGVAWMWTHRRPMALAATSSFALTGLAGALAIFTAWGWEPWRHMLTYTVGTFSLDNLGLQVWSHMAPWAILLAFAARTALREGPATRRHVLVWYWVGAAVWSLSAARVGSSYPYFVDLHLATLLLAGPRIFATAQGRMWSWLLAAQVVGADAGAGAALVTNVVSTYRLEATLPNLCRRLTPEGPVLTEKAGLARACGRTPVIHPFIMSSLHAQGLWDARAFEDAIRRGRYTAAVLPFDPGEEVKGVHAQRWTPGMLAAFRAAPRLESGPDGYWVARW